MSDIIRFRTKRKNDLEVLANKKNISTSQILSEIIEEYLDYYLISSKLNMVRDTKKTISVCFDRMSDSDLDALSEIDSSEVIHSFKVMTNDYSFEKLSSLVMSWFKFSNYEIEEFDESDYVKFVCHNIMSKNWNIHQANVFVKVYSHFGYDGMVMTYEENLLEFKILKKKSI